jgi:hypothetical protein
VYEKSYCFSTIGLGPGFDLRRQAKKQKNKNIRSSIGFIILSGKAVIANYRYSLFIAKLIDQIAR